MEFSTRFSDLIIVRYMNRTGATRPPLQIEIVEFITFLPSATDNPYKCSLTGLAYEIEIDRWISWKRRRNLNWVVKRSWSAIYLFLYIIVQHMMDNICYWRVRSSYLLLRTNFAHSLHYSVWLWKHSFVWVYPGEGGTLQSTIVSAIIKKEINL